MDKYDKYLRLVQWARNRYTKNNELLIHKGFKPSNYSIIEDMAAQKYLNCKSIWNN